MSRRHASREHRGQIPVTRRRAPWPSVCAGLLALLTAAATATSARAVDEGSGTETADRTAPRFSLVTAPTLPGWRFDAALYLWVPAVKGSVTAQGRRADFDLSIVDTVELVFNQWRAMDGGGHFEAHWQRLDLIGDVVGGYMKPGTTATVERRGRPVRFDARVTTHFVFVEAAAAYRVFQWTVPDRSRPLSIGLLAGARFYHMNNEISAKRDGEFVDRSLDAEGALNWADPIIGLRWEIPLLESVAYDFRADIGGFDLGSDLSYSINTGLRWWPGERDPEPDALRPWLGLTYKLLAFNFDESSGAADVQIRGPVAAVGLEF